MAKLVQVIHNLEPRGKGIDGDPVRLVDQWFQTDGTLIFERDVFFDERAVSWADRFWKLGYELRDFLKCEVSTPEDKKMIAELDKLLNKWRKP